MDRRLFLAAAAAAPTVALSGASVSAANPRRRSAAPRVAAPSRMKLGSLSHEGTEMVRWRNEPRVFSVLNDLNTFPRVKYLAAIKNPNPEMG